MPQQFPFAWLFTLTGILAIATIAFFYVKDSKEDVARDSISKMWGKYPLDSWIVKLNTLKKWISLAFWARYALLAFAVHSAFMFVDYSSGYHEDIETLRSVPGMESGHKTLYATENAVFSLKGAKAEAGEHAIIQSTWWFSVPRAVSFESDSYAVSYPTRRNIHNVAIFPISILIVSISAFFMRRGRYHWLYAGLGASAALETAYMLVYIFYCV